MSVVTINFLENHFTTDQKCRDEKVRMEEEKRCEIFKRQKFIALTSDAVRSVDSVRHASGRLSRAVTLFISHIPNGERMEMLHHETVAWGRWEASCVNKHSSTNVTFN